MREILFRGKRIDNGKWTYGYYFYDSFYNKAYITNGNYCMRTSKEKPNQRIINAFEVNAKTVGQYTGMKDKNGTKIFEGDILILNDMDGSKGIQEVFWDGNNGKFAIAASGNRNYVEDFELFERNEYFKWFTVIGNIYDSPEL